MLRLMLAGLDTLVTSPLCSRCPSGPAGCCAAPPALAWVDLGRLVGHGGTEWILGELDAGRLRRCSRGLALERTAGPWGLACTYLGPTGCVLPPNRRSSTCNEYVCEDVLRAAEDASDASAKAARATHAHLERVLGALDQALSAQVRERGDAVAIDAGFLAWLGVTVARATKELQARPTP